MRFLNKNKTFIIAEAGVNHDGELKKAFELVDIAASCSVDAIKFQTFKPSEITTKFNVNVNYVKKNTGDNNYRLLEKLALDYEDFKKIKDYCEKKKILFLSTPDGKESLDYLTEILGLKIIKVGSTEITNLKYLKEISRKNTAVILSTGISNLDEVTKAFNCFINKKYKDICVLHCTSEYPAPDNEINIKAMNSIRTKLGCSVGFSDHSIGNEASISAVSLGADVIEKHFTSDKNLKGPDHSASMDPYELKQFVLSIRRTEKMLGSGVKKASPSELKNIYGIRRGINASTNLKKGILIKKEHLVFKRPFLGINPEDSSKMIGKTLIIDLEADQPILWKYLK